MKKVNFKDVFVPKYRTYLIIIFLILTFMCVMDVRYVPFAVIIYCLVLFLTYRTNISMRERLIKNLDSFIFKLRTDDTVLNFPIPAIIITNQGDILWNNNELEMLFKGINKQKYMETLIKELNDEYDDRFKGVDKEINIHDKHYRLLGNLVNLRRTGKDKETVIMLYFIDRTEYYKLYRMYDDSKDCVGVIMIDNYDELVQGMIDTDRPQLIATVERRLREWFAFTGGIMTNLDRNKYLIEIYKSICRFEI